MAAEIEESMIPVIQAGVFDPPPPSRRSRFLRKVADPAPGQISPHCAFELALLAFRAELCADLPVLFVAFGQILHPLGEGQIPTGSVQAARGTLRSRKRKLIVSIVWGSLLYS